ncbi:hypothetical protein SLEP1_g49947 [Rubroshorea leprosula]|uniref:Uncharacterized protein n=1 Tax=Rubroshorea leprosula TaxID=152421 RepID=A0AAV5LYG7_9ROSI|nr:hypothetical protein SLEP1_g49947 [Rubroshorea leprosula]
MEFLALTITKASSLGYWKGSKAGRRGPSLSHLFFADDLLFIGKATKDNCIFLKSVLDFFCDRSGQRINPSKSNIFFSNNVTEPLREELCNIMGFSHTNYLGKYLGIPISAKRPCKQDYTFILDKVRAKLEGWKTKFFSIAGRTTLINSVLASIPNFYMQSIMLPSSILSSIDRIARDFLWGSDLDHRKLHLVKWEQVSLPKCLGGLGIRSAKEANTTAMAKLNWRLFTEEDKLWNMVLKRKYNISSRPSTLPSNGSPVINSIRKGNNLFLKGIKWTPLDGNDISFWNDPWVLNLPLSSMLQGPLSEADNNLLVADIFPNGLFDPSLISYPFSDCLLDTIKATPISKTMASQDSFAWNGSPNGSFSTKSTCILYFKAYIFCFMNVSKIFCNI